MMKRRDIFKCEICGNIVGVAHVGGGELVCCGKPMAFMEEKNADSSTEKHVPVIEATENGVKVTVGSTLHPMVDAHYIEWIEVINGEYNQRKYLKPGDQPVAEFFVPYSDK
ncbi:MAG TPA: desulfoferrodoxin, partial [bacterium]|nr:desulfoferrodoxin [bacterium]